MHTFYTYMPVETYMTFLIHAPVHDHVHLVWQVFFLVVFCIGMFEATRSPTTLNTPLWLNDNYFLHGLVLTL